MLAPLLRHSRTEAGAAGMASAATVSKCSVRATNEPSVTDIVSRPLVEGSLSWREGSESTRGEGGWGMMGTSAQGDHTKLPAPPCLACETRAGRGRMTLGGEGPL